MCHYRGCHTKAGVSVHICLQIIAHHMAEQCKLFHGELSRTDARHTLCPVFFLKLCKLVSHILKALFPGYFPHGPVCLPDLRKRGRFFNGKLLVQG